MKPEDWHLNLKLAKCYRIKFINQILLSYRWHSKNTIKRQEYATRKEVWGFERKNNFVLYGLDALILSLMSLDITAGDEIIVPANTYLATFLAITANQAIPNLPPATLIPLEIDLGTQEEVQSGRQEHYPKQWFGSIPNRKLEIRRLFSLNLKTYNESS